ncbi:ArsR/SmtB family transcription factor [Kitasatospora sp. NPDC048365]|uniref:ArsR/SmtB family transcription factor n=1 Tax=Kitasatospora sp. NPDC048365 TaxID=3364050 RepID=UPI00370F7BA7
MEPTDEEPVVLNTPAQFKALGHPVRHRMVNVLRQRPATLRQLAEALGVAKGTVGYHVRVLQDAGLVRVAETRQVRGGTEQYFGPAGAGFRLADGIGPEFLFNAALAEMLPERGDGREHTLLRHLWLTPDQARALTTRLQSHADEPCGTGGPTPDAEPYGLLLSLFRADIPSLAPDEA